MPKPTFLNLPEAKRRRIVDLAVEEFAAHAYREASLTRIVRRAGIAKGSIYQYFADKFDLYMYVLQLAADRKLQYIGEALARLGPDPDFFETLAVSVEASIRLAREEPRLLELSANLLREPEDFRARVMGHFGHVAEATFQQWVSRAFARGQLDPNLPVEAAAYVVWTITTALGQDLASGRVTVDEAPGFYREVLKILEHGLRPRERPAP
jgi:AcrR family transcriptional regulator